VAEVRHTFFNYLKPFLSDVPDFIKNMKGKDDSDKVFSRYFDSLGYLKSFQGE